jgi:hypothetical protein
MCDNQMLDGVKSALNITGNFQDETLKQYIEEVTEFLKDAGVKHHHITVGIVARGVSDLWNYGAGGGVLSQYSYRRAAQLSYKK